MFLFFKNFHRPQRFTFPCLIDAILSCEKNVEILVSKILQVFEAKVFC